MAGATLSAIGQGVTSGIASGIGSSISDGISGLFHANYATRAKRQREQYDAMQGIAYKWNEKAADSAAKRQREYYDYTYAMESPEAQRKRLKDAGLSVGLMYSNAGGTIGAGGSSAGGIQGAGGGAQTVDTPAAEKNAQAASQQASVSGMLAASEINLRDAQAEELKASAKEKNANAENLNARTETENLMRQVTYESAYAAGRLNWVQYLRDMFDDAMNKDNLDYAELKADDKFWGEYEIVSNSARNRRAREEVYEIIAKANEANGNADLAQASRDLKNLDIENYLTKLSIELMRGNALAAMAEAQKIQAEVAKKDVAYRYGESITPWMWGQLALQVGGTIIGGIAAARGKGGTTPMQEAWQTLEEMRQKMDAEGNVVETTETQRRVSSGTKTIGK